MYVRVRALQQLEAVRMAAEVLHELSAPQSHGMLNSRFSRTKSLSRRALHCEVAVKKRFLREGEHARELLFLRRVLRRRRALPPPPPCSLLEAQLAPHVV
jgi:hypothetical protein